MNSEAWRDLDAAIARVEAQVVQAQENARRAEALHQEIGAMSARARSSRGEVEVVVGASGRLTNIDLRDSALELSSRALADLILKTVHDAHRNAATRAVEATAEVYGEDSPVTARMRDEAAAMVSSPDDLRSE